MIGGRVAVGYVRRAHGLHGEVVVRPLSDNPDRFDAGSVFLTDDDDARELVVATARRHHDGVLVTFDGINDRVAAERLQGATLTISLSDRRALEKDEFWPDDLAGLVAINPDGEHLGKVTGVVLGEAQDRLVVTTPGGDEVEVPFVGAIVGEIHPSLGHVVLDAPEGLFETGG